MKPIIDFKPPTEEQITLIQPNNVTFGSYTFSQWQENILTLIQEALQRHMSKEKEFNRDLFGQPYVTVRCGEAAGERHKNLVILEARKMMSIQFSFKWVHPQIHKTVETTGVLITNVHDVRGTDTITITLNPWAIPFLLYYGVGVGLTKYDKITALSLPGKYTKRIYKILCSKAGFKNEYFYDLETLKKDFELNPNTPWGEIKRTIIEPAKKAIFNVGMSIYFDYDVITEKPPRGKPAVKTIVFKIVTQQTDREKLVINNEQKLYIYNWLLSIYREWNKPEANQKAKKYADMLLDDPDLMKQVYSRITYYDDKITKGEMVKAKAHNSIKKMLREDYGLE